MPHKFIITVTQTVELDLGLEEGEKPDPHDAEIRNYVYAEFMMRVVNDTIDSESVEVELEEED